MRQKVLRKWLTKRSIDYVNVGVVLVILAVVGYTIYQLSARADTPNIPTPSGTNVFSHYFYYSNGQNTITDRYLSTVNGNVTESTAQFQNTGKTSSIPADNNSGGTFSGPIYQLSNTNIGIILSTTTPTSIKYGLYFLDSNGQATQKTSNLSDPYQSDLSNYINNHSTDVIDASHLILIHASDSGYQDLDPYFLDPRTYKTLYRYSKADTAYAFIGVVHITSYTALGNAVSGGSPVRRDAYAFCSSSGCVAAAGPNYWNIYATLPSFGGIWTALSGDTPLVWMGDYGINGDNSPGYQFLSGHLAKFNIKASIPDIADGRVTFHVDVPSQPQLEGEDNNATISWPGSGTEAIQLNYVPQGQTVFLYACKAVGSDNFEGKKSLTITSAQESTTTTADLDFGTIAMTQATGGCQIDTKKGLFTSQGNTINSDAVNTALNNTIGNALKLMAKYIQKAIIQMVALIITWVTEYVPI
ncbi:MAG: hypothetical protein WC773_03660 [Patescibacteria group bacterium]|jgi:hypothetical protein